MPESNTLATVLRDEINGIMSPLVAVAQQPAGAALLLESLGRTGKLSSHPDLRAEIERLAALAQDLTRIEADTLDSWTGLARVLDLSRGLFLSIRGLGRLVSDPSLGEQGRDLGLDLVQHLLALHLRTRHPNTFRVLSLLTLVTPAELATPLALTLAGQNVVGIPRRADQFHFERAQELLKKPLALLAAHYFPNNLNIAVDAHEAGRRLFPVLSLLAQALSLTSFSGLVRAIPEPVPPETPGEGEGGNHFNGDQGEEPEEPPQTEPVDLTTYFETFLSRFVFVLPGQAGQASDGAETPVQFGISALVSSARHPVGASGLIVSLQGQLNWSQVRDGWQLSCQSDGQVPAFVLGPGGVGKAPTDTLAAATARFLIERVAQDGAPAFVLGAANGTRLEIGVIRFTTDVRVTPGDSDIVLAMDARSGVFVLAPEDADGFLSSLLPRGGLRCEFDLGVELSGDGGLRLRGAAGLDATLPVGLSIGGVSVPTVHLGLRASDAGLQAEVSASIRLSIGPVQALVDRVGLTNLVTFPKEGGNLGVADLDLDFKPPTGAGLKIDSPVVTGGGFLFHDAARGQYGGVLQLEFTKSHLALKAIGLISTRLPGGARGFSMIVIITAEGFQPIPLGLGFTLTGIGGLVAINRTFSEEAVRAGIKNHALEHVLFPKDPILHAARTISSLDTFFPSNKGSYLFGVLAQISWGLSSPLKMNLALILEAGRRLRLIVLGHVSLTLPRAEQDLVRLNMDAVGVIDFDQGTAALDATLYDSRLMKKFVLTGQMALRLRWSDAPLFALSVGGFHPAFSPPPNFPALERIALSLSESEDFRLRCEGYFALTSNTLQFGAHAELFARAGGFSIHGQIGFDVLIQFDPFMFVAGFHASVQLKRGSTNLFKVAVTGELSGPRPLHVKGKATFEIFWCDFSVSFNKTLISGVPPPPPEKVEVMERLTAALRDARNWGGQVPESERRLVTLRERRLPDEVALHPLGKLSVKQSVVPLELEIAKFGQATPAGARMFKINSVSVNGKSVTFERLRDFFAPAEFLEMTDDEKLTAPSFEPLAAGVSLNLDGFILPGNDLDVIEEPKLRYETYVIDDKNQPARQVFEPSGQNPALNATHLDKQLLFGAAARSDVRRTGAAKFSPASVTKVLAKTGWVIVSGADQTRQGVPGIEAGKLVAYAEAFQALQQLKLENPARARGLKIIRASESVN